MKEEKEIRKDLEKKTKAELIEDVVDIKEEFNKMTATATALNEKVLEFAEEVKSLKKEKEGHLQFLRDLISEIGDQDGVLEGGEIDVERTGTDENLALTIAIKQILGVLGYKTSELSLVKK